MSLLLRGFRLSRLSGNGFLPAVIHRLTADGKTSISLAFKGVCQRSKGLFQQELISSSDYKNKEHVSVWIVRWILIATIIIVILGLALQNNELVSISIYTWQWNQIPVWMVFFVSFAAGMIVFLLFSVYHQVQLSVELRRSKKEVLRLQDELEKLKTRAPDEDNDNREAISNDDQDTVEQ